MTKPPSPYSDLQVFLANFAPMAGATIDTLTAPDELLFGEIDNIWQLGPASGAPTVGTINIDSVTMGSQISGSFAGAWDGDENVPAGECSGTFDVTID